MKPAPSSRSHANVRASAARAVSRVLRGSSLDDAMLPINRFRVPSDAAMTRLLAYGVLRELSLLQWLTARMMDKPLAVDDEIHCLLLVGLYQLRNLATPAHAAINETVAAAEIMKRPQAQGFINAVLRRYTREHVELEAGLPDDEAIRHSHPAWLVEQIRVDWPTQWPAILAANNAQGPLTLRVNRRRLTRDAYLQRLSEMNIAAQAVADVPDAVMLAEPRAVEKIPGFNGGQVSVQDASAQLAVDLLELQAGQRVLDACAAPGGKSAHILERADIELTALDRDPQRLIRVDENLRRLRLDARLLAGDGGEPARWWDGKPFHRILLDAPCSGTGVIRRHPDIKWLRRESDISGLQGQQLRLLKSVWRLLKPGGRLLYATCSLLRAEGDDTVQRFVGLHDNAECLPITADWGEATACGRRIAPSPAHDGFYYAALRKTGDDRP
ncbi:16S rRNA (cytosine(967)-C(5))-methyltransferase RsmB [Solimonas terrae]|uniref:16S rRNA (cytosine(967)-C(5))-methyltransferase n=1 Tax=Solimonas terrae TaxID=1396819 RepID=A0A6M2BRT9_9GAMM|nr:16S rRNA (cytosine(967)-C(5))-methyltransferase RsmB [Solimonas terrae]NGY04749.1 16S rRNA (cytosine(967)-C(5))-methyltransferase RsmB [Solimonas terrae]